MTCYHDILPFQVTVTSYRDSLLASVFPTVTVTCPSPPPPPAARVPGIAFPYTTLYYSVMHCIAAFCNVLQCTALYCTVLRCTALTFYGEV